MTDAEAEAPKYLHVSPRCHVRQEIDNIGWVVTPGGVIVVDALEQPQLEAEVLDLIARSAPDTVVTTVVNTHTHFDHIALNDVFQARFGATIINAKTCEIPAAGLVLGPASCPVHVLPMPGCHTQEDLVVWFPPEKVLFVGDIFGWGLIPWDRPLDQDKLDHLLATYQRLIDLEPEVVVPGHGPTCTAKELERWMAYVVWLVSTIKDVHRRGMSRRDVPVEQIKAPADMHSWWRFLKWKHADCVKKLTHAIAKDRLQG